MENQTVMKSPLLLFVAPQCWQRWETCFFFFLFASKMKETLCRDQGFFPVVLLKTCFHKFTLLLPLFCVSERVFYFI